MEAVRLEQNNETLVKAVKPSEVGKLVEQGTIVSIGGGGESKCKGGQEAVRTGTGWAIRG